MDVDAIDLSCSSKFVRFWTWNRFFILLGLIFLFLFAFDFLSFAFENQATDLKVINDPSKWDIEKKGVFSLVFLYFRNKCIAAQANIRPVAVTLISTLMVIQIATTWSLYEGQLRFFELIKEVIRFSFLLFLILNSGMLIDTFIQGFQFFGAVASGLFSVTEAASEADALANSKYFDPSNFIDMGWKAIGNLTSAEKAGPIDKLLLWLCGLLGYLGTVFIGLQITLTSVEFYLFTGLGIILVPFGVLRYTNFLYQKVIQGIFSYGIRMMVVYFMAGLAFNVLKDVHAVAANPDKVNFGEIFNFILLYAVVGYLVWKIPMMVQAMISGSPQMDGSGLASSAVGFATGAMAGGARMAGRAAGTWKATHKDGASGGAGGKADKKPGPEDTAAGANAVSGGGSNNGAMAGSGDQIGPAAKQAQANYAAKQAEGGSGGSAVESASQTSNTPEQAVGGAGGESGTSAENGESGASAGASGGASGSTSGASASGGSGQMSHGDRAWNSAASFIAGTKASLKQYGANVKSDLKESAVSGIKGAAVGAARLGNAAGNAMLGEDTFSHVKETAGKAYNSAKAIASDWTPTPVKQAVRQGAQNVRDSFKKGSHLRNFGAQVGHQAFVHLPGVKQFYDGAYHAGRDMGVYNGAVKGSLKDYVEKAKQFNDDPSASHHR